MPSPTEGITPSSVGFDYVKLLGYLAIVGGAGLLMLGKLLGKLQYEQTVIANIGCGFLTAGALTILFEVQTRRINALISRSIRDESINEFKNLLFGKNGLTLSIENQMTSHNQDSRVTLWEIMKSVLMEDGQRKVFAAGIINAYLRWVGKIPEDFLQSQQVLRIMLKDGRSFFSGRSEELKTRFRNPAFRTRILVLDPEYKHMKAVAEMDDRKIESAKQIQDCRFAISTMQRIREELLSEGIEIKDRVAFRGYSLVPTWTGFIGESLAYVSFFFTRPHRGDLPTLVIRRQGENRALTEFYDAFDTEFDELWRMTDPDTGAASLFDYKL